MFIVNLSRNILPVIASAGVCLFGSNLFASQVAVGYVSWDVNFPGNAGQFDIVNLSGPNVTPPSFPITSQLDLSALNLVVTFVGGATKTYDSSTFTLSADGESFDGFAIPIGGTNPLPTGAILTGNFNETSISDPNPDTILSVFTTTISPSSGSTLIDGDFGVIYATQCTGAACSGGPIMPEPSTWLLLSVGGVITLALWGLKRRVRPAALAKFSILLVTCIAGQMAFGQIVLPKDTSPSTGAAGINNVNITVSNLPAGTEVSNVIVSFENTCGGPAVKTVTANSIRNILGVARINFNLPPGLSSQIYFVQIADTSDPTPFSSTSCSQVQVTASTVVLNACVAGSSMGVLLPSAGKPGDVTAYVPKGYWGGGAVGVYVKNIEGTLGTGANVATANITNSCSSNPATGKTVCVANNTDVYVLSGSTITNTLTSGSNGTGSFSGGSCKNCGVAFNASNNTAVINMGLSGKSGSGVQVLSLDTNTFQTPLPLTDEVSENISVDPTRNLILSASERGNYELVQIQSDGVTLKEFTSTFSIGLESDSSAEDCSTGIAISPQESYSYSIALVNLNAVTFGGSTYSAPVSTVSLKSSYGFSAGLDGSAVAQGSGHLAVVTGEFGGDTFAVLKLPDTAGTSTPALVDYVSAEIPANAACGGTFVAGYDPHTVTAYTSPNDGNSYAVFAGYLGGVPHCLAKVNMTQLITSATRGGSGYQANDISPANFPASAVTFFSLP